MALVLSGLEKAIVSLDEAIQYFNNLPENIDTDIVRDSVIQRFKYTYELSWKFLQRWLKLNVGPEEAEPRTKKDLFRLAARKFLISEPELWFEFSEARNQVAHTYNKKSAKYVFSVATKFLPEAKALFKELESRND